jgi:hypothetical protein
MPTRRRVALPRPSSSTVILTSSTRLKDDGPVWVNVAEQHLGSTSEPTLRDLSEALIADLIDAKYVGPWELPPPARSQLPPPFDQDRWTSRLAGWETPNPAEALRRADHMVLTPIVA